MKSIIEMSNGFVLFHTTVELSPLRWIYLSDKLHIQTQSLIFHLPSTLASLLLLYFLHFFLPWLPVEEPTVGPRDLQVSELAYSSLRLTWSQATGDVTGYRLLVTPLTSRGNPLHHKEKTVRRCSQWQLRSNIPTWKRCSWVVFKTTCTFLQFQWGAVDTVY